MVNIALYADECQKITAQEEINTSSLQEEKAYNYLSPMQKVIGKGAEVEAEDVVVDVVGVVAVDLLLKSRLAGLPNQLWNATTHLC